MILRFLFSATPFVLLNLLAPDVDSSGGNPTPTPGPFDAESAPALEGETLETKNTSAAGIIDRLFAAGKDLVSRLATANNERARIEGQFNAVSGDLKTEKDAHTVTKGELGTAKTTITGLTTERDNANKNVERLEKLCNLRGIDPNTVVPPANNPQDGPGANVGIWDQYQNIRTQEQQGKVAHGASLAFYQKNSKALREHQKSQQTPS